MHALEAVGRAHVEDVVAHDEVGGLDQLDAHLAREEGVLEVGGVERARRPHHDGRLGVGAGRHRAQRREQQLRVVVDRAHAVLGEELGDQPRHRHPVLEHVGDARRRAHVVLEHPPGAVGVAHQVAAGHVRVDAAGRADAVHDAREVAARDDQPPRHDALADDLARVVDVVDEGVERADALRQAALDRDPLVGRDDPRDEVQREGAVLGAVLAGQLEGDALLHEDGVAPAPGGGEVLGAHLLQGGDELRRVRARGAAAAPAKTSSRKPSRAWYSIGAVAGSEAIGP